MIFPRIKNDIFEIYPQCWSEKGNIEWTLEIDVDVDGGCCYRGNISIDYNKLKEFYDYITQQQLSAESNDSTLPNGNVR